MLQFIGLNQSMTRKKMVLEQLSSYYRHVLDIYTLSAWTRREATSDARFRGEHLNFNPV